MLKTYLEKRGILQKHFASELHVSRSYISLLVNRKRTPSPKLAMKIEKKTNGYVDVMWLLYDKDNDKDNKPRRI